MKNEIPRLSNKETYILKGLCEASCELYGLEMVKKSGGQLKRGTIYVTLDRMEDKGYIESRREKRRPGARGMPRRLYKLTGYGQRVAHAWETAAQQFATEGSV